MIHHRALILFAILLAAGCSDKKGTMRSSPPGSVGGGGGGGGGGAPVSPAGWNSSDIGAVGIPGTTSFVADQVLISASGGDIWNGADAFRFVYRSLNGDGEIVARVDSLEQTDAWAKSGVMIRESLNDGSRFAMSVVTPVNGACFQYRTEPAQGAGMGPTSAASPPCWLKVSRVGNLFSGAFSLNGTTWTALGSQTITMGAAVYIGLAVTAHNNAADASSTISQITLSAGSGGGGGGGGGSPPAPTQLQPVAFSNVALNDNFWAPRIENNRTQGLQIMYQSFIDNHNIDNFSKAAGLMPGNHDGFLWCDSDVYKTLEGMAKAIALHPDADLQAKLDSVITKIAAAQVSSGPLSGYIDTYFQLGNAGRGSGGTTLTKQPWEDLQAMHEDYCHGHLIEAAIAHHQATGQPSFLNVARKLADHMEATFGVGKRSGVPGHQEAEIALLKLWAVAGTGKQADFDLAKFYLDERGRHSGGRPIFGEYCQDLAPLRDISEPLGHGVRGPYMWAAAVDVAAATNDAALLTALQALWQNIVDKKMAITGGTGHRLYNEGYAPDYDLSNDLSYNETCSACATMMFSQRLANQLGDAKYMDVLERVLYNGFASGRSIDGTRMYYNNFLTRYGNRGRMGIACCATNIVRVVPSVPGYQYATKAGDGVWTHLYMAGQATLSYGGATLGIKQETNYPWDGAVKLTITTAAPAAFTLHLRIPEWAGGATATVNGGGVNMGDAVKGYLPITRTWQNNDVVQLSLPLNIRRVYPNSKDQVNQGRVAILRGPIVYCLESNDNSISPHKIVIPSGAGLSSAYNGGLLGGVTTVSGTGQNADNNSSVGFTMIPYGCWDNRSHDSLMTVMVPETGAAAPQKFDRNRVANATVSYSYKNGGDTESALNDGILPDGSNDATMPRFTWWSHQGTAEWVQYDLPAPITITRSDILWYSDADQGGGCDNPQTFNHQYWNGSSWQPLVLQHDYMNMIDLYGGHFTILRFQPVTTSKVRLNVQLKPGKSGGILEWRLPEN